MQGKIKLYHFHNGSGGGVLSVIKNLVRFSDPERFEHHIIYTINRDLNRAFCLPDVAHISSQQLFYYSPTWNFHHTCKRLYRLIPDENSVIVANDWLELGMVSHAGLQNPVIQILHGDYDYYYNLSRKHQEWINAYVTVADIMSENLKNVLPNRVSDIYYLPFPVPAVQPKAFSKSVGPLKVIFVGRLTKEKGYDLLPLIDRELKQRNIEIYWNIIGQVTKATRSVWSRDSKVEFYGMLSNEKVIDLMQDMECLVLPSLAEGMPVTVVEAMKSGLTCLVNDLPGGTGELIEDGVTGFKVKGNEVKAYAAILEHCNGNRTSLAVIGKHANEKAEHLFNPVINTRSYEQLFEKCFRLDRKGRKAGRVYGSRLDQKWIPNFITRTIRSF